MSDQRSALQAEIGNGSESGLPTWIGKVLASLFCVGFEGICRLEAKCVIRQQFSELALHKDFLLNYYLTCPGRVGRSFHP